MFGMCNHLKTPLKFIKNIHGDMIYTAGGKRSIWGCTNCGKTILMDEPFYMGEVSDGYHTFNELYHHRAVLFSVICNSNPELAWKSKLHHDGTMYDGMFIVGVETPDGQATYHYDIEPYWAMFRVPELPQAPEWDGHTPAQAIERISKLSAQPENSRQHALQTGVCPMCEECPDGCPVETPKDSRNIVTNADRIRGMSDEELANELTRNPPIPCRMCEYWDCKLSLCRAWTDDFTCTAAYAEALTLDWLKAETEGKE